MTGQDVYRKLMDVEIILGDGDKMIPLNMFLNSIRDNHPSLIKLGAEVDAFKQRIEQLLLACQGK